MVLEMDSLVMLKYLAGIHCSRHVFGWRRTGWLQIKPAQCTWQLQLVERLKPSSFLGSATKENGIIPAVYF